MTSLRQYLSITFLTLFTWPLLAQVPPLVNPGAALDLHTHAEWRVNSQIEFDGSGRLLILYRDKSELNPSGNWHLIRLTPPLSTKSLREEIVFSIPQEPSDPDAKRRWDGFASHLLLSSDGTHAYATFSGAVVTAKPGLPPTTVGRNVNVVSFSSVISFDLVDFRLLATWDATQHSTNFDGERIDAEGNLLLLHTTDADWNIEILDKFLRHASTVTIRMGPVETNMRYSCQFLPDLKIECPEYGGGAMLLSSQSVVRLPQSACKMTLKLDPFGFGKHETLNDERIIQSDHLCIRNDAGHEELVSPDLLPRCHQGWQAAAISPDRHSLLAACYEPDSFLDTVFWSHASLQIIDAPTLLSRVRILLSSRHRSNYAIFHSSGTTTVAVLEDGVKLLLYTCSDKSASSTPT